MLCPYEGPAGRGSRSVIAGRMRAGAGDPLGVPDGEGRGISSPAPGAGGRRPDPESPVRGRGVRRGVENSSEDGSGAGLPASRNHSVADLCPDGLDRKSTRLNSSHGSISYAVFCLKKKTIRLPYNKLSSRGT